MMPREIPAGPECGLCPFRQPPYDRPVYDDFCAFFQDGDNPNDKLKAIGGGRVLKCAQCLKDYPYGGTVKIVPNKQP
jgi:hypothetical protein